MVVTVPTACNPRHQNPLASPHFGDATGQQYGHHSMGSRMMKLSIPLPGLILGVANYVILALTMTYRSVESEWCHEVVKRSKVEVSGEKCANRGMMPPQAGHSPGSVACSSSFPASRDPQFHR